MNPFDVPWAARRYAEGRPNVHPRVLAPLRSFLDAGLPERALDLGCGTGLSSVALTRFATRVVATDVSPEMLRAASHHPSVFYVRARAERLPFRPASFELATLGCVFHWCKPDSLFAELDRVLCQGALLLIYDNGFFGEMRELDSAKEWFSSVYRAQYPAPPRRAAFRPELVPAPFRVERSEFIDEWIPFTLEELIRYLTTQSNVIDAVESGLRPLADLEVSLRRDLAPFYRSAGTSRAHFRFGGLVHLLRHVGSSEGGAP
jgi:SAM-dependent methyltransferase